MSPAQFSLEELHEIAEESSHSERRADEAERELMEWKKAKFMQDRVGEDFDGLIISVTKFGFFVELTDLFVEGLVPLDTLTDDHYTYHENTREIIGQRSRKIYRLGPEDARAGRPHRSRWKRKSSSPLISKKHRQRIPNRRRKKNITKH